MATQEEEYARRRALDRAHFEDRATSAPVLSDENMNSEQKQLAQRRRLDKLYAQASYGSNRADQPSVMESVSAAVSMSAQELTLRRIQIWKKVHAETGSTPRTMQPGETVRPTTTGNKS